MDARSRTSTVREHTVMTQPPLSAARAALLSFNGGFVDTAGFLGLQGLFTTHVTGNFVTLGATLVFGTHGAIAKVLALPEFVAVVAVTQLAGAALARHRLPGATASALSEGLAARHLLRAGCGAWAFS
jgi:uncharacterized membrane protein YoaK (UPF0700 family)